jgi:hypothetical protein
VGTSKNKSFKSGIQNASQQSIKSAQPLPFFFTQRGRARRFQPEATAGQKDPLVDKMGNPIKGIDQTREATTGVGKLGRPVGGRLAGGPFGMITGGKATATMSKRKSDDTPGKTKEVEIPNPTPPIEDPKKASQGLNGNV